RSENMSASMVTCGVAVLRVSLSSCHARSNEISSSSKRLSRLRSAASACGLRLMVFLLRTSAGPATALAAVTAISSKRNLVVQAAAGGPLGGGGFVVAAAFGWRGSLEAEVLVFGRPLQHLVWTDPADDAEGWHIARRACLLLHDVE